MTCGRQNWRVGGRRVPSDLRSGLLVPTEAARFGWTGDEDCRGATAADILLGPVG